MTRVRKTAIKEEGVLLLYANGDNDRRTLTTIRNVYDTQRDSEHLGDGEDAMDDSRQRSKKKASCYFTQKETTIES